jgi:hypothetical protein
VVPTTLLLMEAEEERRKEEEERVQEQQWQEGWGRQEGEGGGWFLSQSCLLGILSW